MERCWRLSWRGGLGVAGCRLVDCMVPGRRLLDCRKAGRRILDCRILDCRLPLRGEEEQQQRPAPGLELGHHRDQGSSLSEMNALHQGGLAHNKVVASLQPDCQVTQTTRQYQARPGQLITCLLPVCTMTLFAAYSGGSSTAAWGDPSKSG